jgi:hypothetical protein
MIIKRNETLFIPYPSPNLIMGCIHLLGAECTLMYFQTMAEEEGWKYKYLKNTLKITLCVEKQGSPLPLELFL